MWKILGPSLMQWCLLKIPKAHCRPSEYYLEYLCKILLRDIPKTTSQKIFHMADKNGQHSLIFLVTSRVLLTKYAQKFLRKQTNLNKYRNEIQDWPKNSENSCHQKVTFAIIFLVQLPINSQSNTEKCYTKSYEKN